MSICYMLVGCPGSGKTTFVNTHHFDFQFRGDTNLPLYTGTDVYIERIAETLELTYNDIFKDAYKLAEKLFWNDIVYCVKEDRDIIIDRTSMSRASRYKFFQAMPHYRFEAVVFPVPDNLQDRLKAREGKFIPNHVVQSMINSFEMPSMSEGFSAVWTPESFAESLNA